jgi:hypothetical protein
MFSLLERVSLSIMPNLFDHLHHSSNMVCPLNLMVKLRGLWGRVEWLTVHWNSHIHPCSRLDINSGHMDTGSSITLSFPPRPAKRTRSNGTYTLLSTPFNSFSIMYTYVHMLITVAARSKAWIVFVRSNTGIVCSNHTRGIDVCIVSVYSVFVLFCV